MRIHCITTFLDGPDRFEAGDSRTVDAVRAQRFIAQGWAREDVADPSPAPVAQSEPDTALDIQNSQVGVGDSNA